MLPKQVFKWNNKYAKCSSHNIFIFYVTNNEKFPSHIHWKIQHILPKSENIYNDKSYFKFIHYVVMSSKVCIPTPTTQRPC
jgi:hypothetical protein